MLWPDPVAAQQAPRQDSAIQIGRRALSAYSRGEFALSLREFRLAEERAHSPVFVLFMARCHRALGELLQARALLQRVAAEQLESSAPTPWHQAVASAHAELGSLVTQIPSLWVQRNASGEPRELWLDGERIDVSFHGTELELNPGAHRFEIRHGDGTLERGELTLEQGQRRVPLPLRTTAPPSRLHAPAPLPHLKSRTSLRRALGYGAVCASAASLAVGITAGVIAWQMADRIKSRCTPEGVCRPEDASGGEKASDWAAVSTLSFIAAAGLLTVGTVAIAVSPRAGAGASLVISRSF